MQVLDSHTLTATLGQESTQAFPESGLRLHLQGRVERRGWLQLALTLGSYRSALPVEEGALVVIRGVAPITNTATP